ncbi:hypothetical protein [Kribbella deserti]|uniref:SPW repeat-containing protein n=1 Tax=Kribbella deserti TaxID=1926257 RepID=A0ABV6QT08_9ACTN
MVLEKQDERTLRRRFGWVVPVGIASAINTFANLGDDPLTRADHPLLGMAALLGAGIGVAWGCLDPRDLSDRFALPALVTVVFGILLLLPLGELDGPGPLPLLAYFLGLGAGLVMAAWWTAYRTPVGPAES